MSSGSLDAVVPDQRARHRGTPCSDVRQVLFVVPAAPGHNGDVEMSCFVLDQAASLECTDWNVALFPLVDRRTPSGIVRSLRQLHAAVQRERPAVIHAQYGSITAALAVLGSDQAPVLVSFCGDDLLGTPIQGLRWRLREWVARRLGIWAARRAAVIVVKSQNLLNVLPPALRQRAVVVPNGVDIDLFRPESREICRQRLGWAAADLVVLFNASTADNQPVKNLALAEAAMRDLRRKHDHGRLVPLSNWDRARVAMALNAADCLLITSHHEGSPNIVKEAMACNLPIVAVRCGDVAERLDGVTPGVVCEYDASALADALHRVLVSRTRSNGRARLLEQGLDAASVASRLAQIYARAAEARATAPPVRVSQ